jgi:hypothetical protein
MFAETRSGVVTAQDGYNVPARFSRIGALVTGDTQGRYYENASRGFVFSLTLPATSATPTAGNIYPITTSAPVTQFALWNPPNSGKNLSLLKFGVAPVSGTAPAGPVVHCVTNVSWTSLPTLATTIAYPIQCNNTSNPPLSVAKAITNATGTAATGFNANTSTVPYLRLADFWMTAGSEANLAGMRAIEYIDGEIVIAPGSYWAPCWSGAGTSFLVGYSVTWEELFI